jgi:hypothetical protein
MNDRDHSKAWLRFLPMVLPTTYILLCAITAISGKKAATGGNPFVCVSLPFSLPFVALDDSSTIIVVAVLAATWWYFVGQIGWSSKQGSISRFSSSLGAILIGFVVTADSVLMFGESSRISRESNFNAVDIVIYLLAVTLMVGGLVSAACSAMAVIGINRR